MFRLFTICSCLLPTLCVCVSVWSARHHKFIHIIYTICGCHYVAISFVCDSCINTSFYYYLSIAKQQKLRHSPTGFEIEQTVIVSFKFKCLVGCLGGSCSPTAENQVRAWTSGTLLEQSASLEMICILSSVLYSVYSMCGTGAVINQISAELALNPITHSIACIYIGKNSWFACIT